MGSVMQQGTTNSSIGLMEQKLHQVKYRARVLTTFAGLIPLRCDDDFKAEMGRLEAFMV
jgi:hypothetical protein